MSNKAFEKVHWVGKSLCTENLIPGKRVYDEDLLKKSGKEYRVWDPRRSKPSAAIHKGLHQFPIREGFKILYLGFASGTTGSHLSDIVGKKGLIYGIDVSERVLRDALSLAETRKNIVPILANARNPEDYPWVEQVDLVYSDCAIPDMTDVLIRNAKLFLKPGGWAMIALKSRSIDVTKNPKIVYKEEKRRLEAFFKVVDFVTLGPFERDHGFAVLKMK